MPKLLPSPAPALIPQLRRLPTLETPASDSRSMVKLRVITLAVILLPLVGFIAAIAMLWGTAIGWTEAALFVAMYVIAGIGVTVGFHRLFTHRSFTAPTGVRIALAIAGSMAAQGPLMQWVAHHRRHHQHSDDDGDPHSPHLHGDSAMGSLRGLLHAHVGWMVSDLHRGLARYVGDLRKDALLGRVSRLFPLWVALGLLVPALVGGLVSMSWTGALLGFLWGGLARVFIGHHMTWSINSVCHLWGSRPYDCGDESRNNAIFGVLSFGEGWHNNHHAFPNSARHGLRWWQFDSSYWFIRGLELIGLASEVRIPSKDRLAAKRLN